MSAANVCANAKQMFRCFSWIGEFDPLVLVDVNLEDPPNSCKQLQIVAEFHILYHSGELINRESARMAINEEEILHIIWS